MNLRSFPVGDAPAGPRGLCVQYGTLTFVICRDGTIHATDSGPHGAAEMFYISDLPGTQLAMILEATLRAKRPNWPYLGSEKNVVTTEPTSLKT